MASVRGWIASFGRRGGWWVLVQFPMLALAALIPIRESAAPWLLPVWLVAPGWLAFAAGSLLFAVAAATLGRYLTPFPEPQPQSRLRTDGVYALVRHPIYASVLLMAFGWALAQRSGVGLLFDVLLFVFFDRKVAREELRLAARFADYGAYRQRVKKLIPWIY
jgi:protein-S-isoprenylcysteine O-methyltransferase Ste14